MLVIPGETATARQPGQGALDDPAFGKHLKALGIIGALDDRDLPVADLANGLGGCLALVARVRKDDLDEREQRAGRAVED